MHKDAVGGLGREGIVRRSSGRFDRIFARTFFVPATLDVMYVIPQKQGQVLVGAESKGRALGAYSSVHITGDHALLSSTDARPGSEVPGYRHISAAIFQLDTA